jgi:hypothetical protein
VRSQTGSVLDLGAQGCDRMATDKDVGGLWKVGATDTGGIRGTGLRQDGQEQGHEWWGTVGGWKKLPEGLGVLQGRQLQPVGHCRHSCGSKVAQTVLTRFVVSVCPAAGCCRRCCC